MKYIKSILAISIFSFLTLNFASAQTEMAKYCNNRFDFCIEYPADIFTEKMLSANGDGVELTNADGNAYLLASGANNVIKTSVEAEYKNFMNYIVHTEGQVKEIDSQRVGNMLEISVQTGNRYIFYRSYIFEEVLVAMMIKTDMPEQNASLAAFNYLKDAVKLEVEYPNRSASLQK